MNELRSKLDELARAHGADLLGVAGVDRFTDVPPERHPLSIFPDARSVIVIGRRITRGTLRGVEEGTHFQAYDLFGYNWLDNRFVAMTVFQIVEFLEDGGWEAVPLPPLPAQIPPMGIPVREGQPPPNVLVDIPDAAVRAGLGEIGYCGVLLTPQFGPRQRLQVILTDAELPPDPLFEGELCDMCLECAEACPPGAISQDERATLDIAGKQMTLGAIDFAKCRQCKNGAKPNMYHASGEPDRLAALCVRTCIDRLERQDKLAASFRNPFRDKPAWALDEIGRRIPMTEAGGEGS